MKRTIPFELYNPALSISENAEILHCSSAAVRKYIKESELDRKYDIAYLKWKNILDYNRKHPNSTYKEKQEALGYTINTIRKYESLTEEELRISKRDTNKVSYFDIKNINSIKSISTDQEQILLWIIKLYNNNQPYQCDLTYSLGYFYKGRVPEPDMKYDKYPQLSGVHPLYEADKLPDGSFASIVYDLPFISITKNYDDALIQKRFTSFETVEEAYKVNEEMLNRAIRLLHKDGLLVVKTMDYYKNGKQQWLSDYVIQCALSKGLKMIDKFILIAKKRLFYNTHNQYSARKYHCYFLVFRKH